MERICKTCCWWLKYADESGVDDEGYCQYYPSLTERIENMTCHYHSFTTGWDWDVGGPLDKTLNVPHAGFTAQTADDREHLSQLVEKWAAYEKLYNDWWLSHEG